MVYSFLDEVKDTVESNLPASSAGVAKVIETIYDSKSNARSVAQTIEHDPSLSVNVLKVANSAYYGVSSTITSIQRAVVILGFNTLKELVSSVSFASCFNSKEVKGGNDPTGFWYHAVGTAKACQFVSENISGVRPDVVYMAGLLHDIGKILLTLFFPERYEEVLNLAREKNARIILAERKLLQTDHCEVGNLLCDMWSLPEDLKTIILHHHEPSQADKDHQKLTRIVELGDYLCREAGIGTPGDSVKVAPSPSALHLLGSKPEMVSENIKEILMKLESSKPEIENFFKELEKE